MTESSDEFGPYFDAPTGPDDPLAPPYHPGAPGMCLDRYKYFRVPGPWWRFWRRHDVREVARYRPAQKAVLVGGPCDGTVYGTTARVQKVAFPVFSEPPPAADTYSRTGEVDAEGRHVFRYEGASL